MNILAIDPGSIESAYVLMDEHYKPIQFGKIGNENMFEIIEETMPDKVVIEMVASYGMAVGESVFDFNPRPPRGERHSFTYTFAYDNDFNPRPPRGERLSNQRFGRLTVMISIHAPRVGSDEDCPF